MSEQMLVRAVQSGVFNWRHCVEVIALIEGFDEDDSDALVDQVHAFASPLSDDQLYCRDSCTLAHIT